MALFPVQRQSQALIQETLNTGHHPRASSLTAHIDVRVVGITHEAMASPFQFAVELFLSRLLTIYPCMFYPASETGPSFIGAPIMRPVTDRAILKKTIVVPIILANGEPRLWDSLLSSLRNNVQKLSRAMSVHG
ncbi:hypothetical protein TU79_21965 [Pseudomonas trivialis]|uniref:Uncharacterized protein n=1 Tax=Pseudomonas trivialis TaxID=200450 RepID=A0A0R2ZB92_9PSED|nr:hypothetical protein TU79_21965 [Pseudomonas trivialis]